MKNLFKQIKIYKLILLIIWCIVIFSFSMQNGTSSTSLTDKVINYILNIFASGSLDSSLANMLVEAMVYPVRKIAHLSEYFILAIFAYNVIKDITMPKSYKYIYTILFALTYALSDEFHQLFIPGRSGSLIDVLIDTAGACTAIVLVTMFSNFKRKKSVNKI